jgi:hypothetical protein
MITMITMVTKSVTDMFQHMVQDWHPFHGLESGGHLHRPTNNGCSQQAQAGKVEFTTRRTQDQQVPPNLHIQLQGCKERGSPTCETTECT